MSLCLNQVLGLLAFARSLITVPRFKFLKIFLLNRLSPALVLSPTRRSLGGAIIWPLIFLIGSEATLQAFYASQILHDCILLNYAQYDYDAAYHERRG